MRCVLFLFLILLLASCSKKKKLLEGCWRVTPCYVGYNGSCIYMFYSNNTYTRDTTEDGQKYRLIGNELRLGKSYKVKIVTLNEMEMVWDRSLGGKLNLIRCEQ